MPFKNKEDYNAYQRVYQRNYKRQHPQKINPEVNRKAVAKYYGRNKTNINEKRRCQIMAERHIPLDNKCIFCGATEDLEHGHLDYEDNGLNCVTVCRTCNCWMTKPIGEEN